MSNGNEDLEAFIQQNNLPLSLKNTLLSETTKLQVRIDFSPSNKTILGKNLLILIFIRVYPS